MLLSKALHMISISSNANDTKNSLKWLSLISMRSYMYCMRTFRYNTIEYTASGERIVYLKIFCLPEYLKLSFKCNLEVLFRMVCGAKFIIMCYGCVHYARIHVYSVIWYALCNKVFPYRKFGFELQNRIKIKYFRGVIALELFVGAICIVTACVSILN